MLNFLITDLRLAYPIRHTAQKAASPGFFLLPHTPSKGERKALFLLDNNRGCLCLNFNGARYLETSMCTQEKKKYGEEEENLFPASKRKGCTERTSRQFPFYSVPESLRLHTTPLFPLWSDWRKEEDTRISDASAHKESAEKGIIQRDPTTIQHPVVQIYSHRDL